MSDPASTAALFLSYARDDAAAARRIAEALRAGGLEVWFDENEHRGGDAWDQKIRHQIDTCTLFVPIISKHTEARPKGYFRLEWKLAVAQTHLLAEGVPFIAPIVIDHTRENGARVPAEFLRVQWTRLPDALPTPQLVAQMRRLLERTPVAAMTAAPIPMRTAPAFETAPPPPARRRFPVALVVALAVAALALGAYIALRPAAKERAPAPSAPKVGDARPASAPEKSVAVLLTTSERLLIGRGLTRSQEAYDLYARARALANSFPVQATREQYEHRCRGRAADGGGAARRRA